jgi:hypothetical protein
MNSAKRMHFKYYLHTTSNNRSYILTHTEAGLIASSVFLPFFLTNTSNRGVTTIIIRIWLSGYGPSLTQTNTSLLMRAAVKVDRKTHAAR